MSFLFQGYDFFNAANISWRHQADKIGLHLASKACYDPQAAVECVSLSLVMISQPFFWLTVVIGSHRMQTRLAQMERKMGRLNIDFIYTHPTGQKRINVSQTINVLNV